MSERDLKELEEIQRWHWEQDLKLREEAKSDPALAALLAEADAEYQRKHGVPWVNPLANEG